MLYYRSLIKINIFSAPLEKISHDYLPLIIYERSDPLIKLLRDCTIKKKIKFINGHKRATMEYAGCRTKDLMFILITRRAGDRVLPEVTLSEDTDESL